jgi:hypothetical protein
VTYKLHIICNKLYRFGNTGRGSENYTKHRESCSTVFAAIGITPDGVGECFACHSVLQSSRWDIAMTAAYMMCYVLSQAIGSELKLPKFSLQSNYGVGTSNLLARSSMHYVNSNHMKSSRLKSRVPVKNCEKWHILHIGRLSAECTGWRAHNPSDYCRGRASHYSCSLGHCV